MADNYGVGRSSIREAINALVVMDIIVSMQGKGTFVKEKTVETEPVESGINDIFKVRQCIQSHGNQRGFGMLFGQKSG